jgi:integrase
LAAKVKWDRGAWWVFTHYEGKRRKKRVGSAKGDKRRAERIAEKINAALVLGQFGPEKEEKRKPLPCDVMLKRWHATYRPTFKRSFEIESDRIIKQHLVPFFAGRDLREITREDLLRYVQVKLDAKKSPLTIQTHLSVLRRVLSLAVERGDLQRNPAARLGQLISRVQRKGASEAREVDSWSREEVDTLLQLARSHETRFYPALLFLISTGARRGEALGLKWSDVDFDRGRLHIRRAIVRGEETTPKNGRGRAIAMAPGLASVLFDLLAERRTEALQKGWRETPEWVFCAETGGPLDSNNFERSWLRLRRRAQKKGVRPLKLHYARHTWASLAIASGKSVRWVADQLGHSSPMLTLKTYADALPEEEADLSFVDFGGPGRPYTAPPSGSDAKTQNGPDLTDRDRFGFLERETGLEPATSTLATWCSTN